MPKDMMRRTVIATNNSGAEHRAGQFITPTDDDAIKKAKANFEAAPILKNLLNSPGFKFVIVQREYVET